MQIESADAARNVDDILALQGVDAVFLGPNDLAFSMLTKGAIAVFEHRLRR